MTRMDRRQTKRQRRRRRSFAILLPCVTLLAFQNPPTIHAFSSSPSIQSPFSLSSSESISSSTLSTFHGNHNFHPKSSERMRTQLRTTNKDTESSSSSSVYSEMDHNSDSQPQEEEAAVNGKSKKQQNLSVMDKVSGMFKMSKPNLSLPKTFFPPFAPKPPKEAPHVDAQLQVDLMNSERWIQMLQAEVQMLRERLDFQQDDYVQLQDDLRQAQKLKEHQQEILEEQHELEAQHFAEQRQELETTKLQLDLVQQNMTTMETNHQDQLASQSQEFAKQRELLQGQISDLEAQLATITSDFEQVNQTLASQRSELKEAQQSAETQTESLKQQIAKLDASLKQANSTNEELQVSLDSSNAALESLQKDWKNLVAKQAVKQEAQDQVASLQAQNSETQLALETTQKLLQETIGEQEDLALETKKNWLAEREDLESQVENLQLQLASAKMTKEKVLKEFKSTKAENQLKQKDQEQLLEESQAAIELLEKELAETKTQYETDLESMTLQKSKDVQALTERIQTEHARQEDELKDENAKLKEELAQMKRQYQKSEQERQAETKALETKLAEQQETSEVEASQREQDLQTQLETATAEHDSKLKSLEAEMDKLRTENESLALSLADATKTRDESIEKAMVLQTKYHDLRTDQEKWEERVSLMKREFQHAQETNKELEAQLVSATLEKEEFLLKAQTLEAQLQTLTQSSPQMPAHQTAQQVMSRRRKASNFEWAIDTHSPNRVKPI